MHAGLSLVKDVDATIPKMIQYGMFTRLCMHGYLHACMRERAYGLGVLREYFTCLCSCAYLRVCVCVCLCICVYSVCIGAFAVHGGRQAGIVGFITLQSKLRYPR